MKNTLISFLSFCFIIIRNIKGSKSVDARSILLNTVNSAEGLVLVVLCYQEQKESSYFQFHRVLRFYQGLLEDIHELGFKIKLLHYKTFITMTPNQSLAMIILKCK